MKQTERQRQWRAWCLYDWANSAFSTVVLTAVFPVWFAALLPAGGVTIPGSGRPLPATALWGYLVSGSLLVVVLLAPLVGRWADRHGRQRACFRFFALLGAVATLGLSLVSPPDWQPAALLFCLANLGFATGNSFYNAFLPLLATGEGQLDRLSARGFATGYAGGGLALLAVFGLLQAAPHFGLTDATATRLGLLFTGVWWLLFALPALYRMPETAARPELPKPGLATLCRDLGRYPQLLRFLLAFLLYNDGVQTMIVVAALFARQELGMSRQAILGCFLLIQFLALPGTLLCERLARRIGPRPTLLGAIGVFFVATLWATVMRYPGEFWLLGILVALVLGGVQSLSRSLFARLVPRQKTAEFFGFFAAGNKLAAISGPLVFALANQLTGSTRLAVAALLPFFLIGAILLCQVDLVRGEARAGRCE